MYNICSSRYVTLLAKISYIYLVFLDHIYTLLPGFPLSLHHIFIFKQLNIKFKKDTLWAQAWIPCYESVCVCLLVCMSVYVCLHASLHVSGPVWYVLSGWSLSLLRSWAQLDSNRNKDMILSLNCYLALETFAYSNLPFTTYLECYLLFFS